MTARIAGLLHLAEHGTNAHTRPVTADTVSAAIELGEYFATHALAVFDRMGADPTVARATTVLETLRRHDAVDIGKRDLLVKLSRSEFATVADLEPASISTKTTGGWVCSPSSKQGVLGLELRHAQFLQVRHTAWRCTSGPFLAQPSSPGKSTNCEIRQFTTCCVGCVGR